MENRLKGVDNDTPSFQAQQHRYGVTKHVFFMKGNDRLQAYISSASSILTLNHENERTEMVEHFTGLKCSIQETLLHHAIAPQQMVRSLEAAKGMYYYKTEELVAEQVKLSRYKIPGHELIKTFEKYTPFMSGMAKQIKLSLSHKDPAFKAESFQAGFKGMERLKK
jgi:hypothetical protein